jgi:N-acyl-phosphatidylethanolamine-hydrolysing phospholipase D
MTGKNGRFINPWDHQGHGVGDILRWKLGSLLMRRKAHEPEAMALPQCLRLDSSRLQPPTDGSWRATWLGHSSFLVQSRAISLLIDPIFTDYCSPVPLPQLRRKTAAPCRVADLPKIDAVLLTHSHYDHLDIQTLRQLGTETRLITPQGHAHWLAKKGFRNVIEIPWHGVHAISDEITITATPAQHFTARSLWDRDLGHWCGWLIQDAHSKLWHAGDTGYCPAFHEIGERHGPIDFGMIPIGAYQPRHIMRPMHLNPAEAVTAFLHTRCRRAAAMHWGTFRLTDEPLGEPPIMLERARCLHNIPANAFSCHNVGDILEIRDPENP